MCGIAGLVYRDRESRVGASTLLAMRDIMVHRGPDEAGVYRNGHVGLAHRRLSIIDLSSGQQPMSTEDGRFTIVYNGEIYNYKELRQELEAAGQIFSTKSDTEVILRLIATRGGDAAERLNGIFAFAVYDRECDRLLLARDRMGIKPLYYTRSSRGLVFASEIKALFSSGLVSPACSPDAVPEYFVFRQVAGERTLFQDVFSLLPGHVLVYENGEAKTRRYWSVFDHENSRLGFREAVDELDRILTTAVEGQLMSDVPLGTFCSGGVDSSLITAIAAKLGSEQLNTYSVGFHESAFDESFYARMVSDRCGTRHHELKVDSREFADHLPALVWHNDEPLNFPNSVQIYAISRLAKERVTVVLTGEGSDELFGGYPRYFIPWLLGPVTRLPKPVQAVCGALLGLWRDHRMQKLREYAAAEPRDILMYNIAACAPEKLRPLFHNNSDWEFAYRQDLVKPGTDRDPIRRLALIDQQTYLLSILNRQDKMSMAASVEARVPFLDNSVVDFANALPTGHKMRFPRRKRVLMALAGRYLPRDVVVRRKSGFGVPLRDWFQDRAGLGQYLAQISSNPLLTEFFDSTSLGALVDQQVSGKADHSDFLWAAVNFVLWRQQFGA